MGEGRQWGLGSHSTTGSCSANQALVALPALYDNNSIDGEQHQDQPSQKNRPIIRHQLIQGSPKRTPKPSPHQPNL
jgi:hypothetical protein